MAEKISRKDQIEQQATLLFQKKGFAATSMRDLATALKIEASSLYAHIQSKEELLRTICFKMAESFFEALDEIETLEIPTTKKLRAAIIAHVKVIAKNSPASAVFYSEWRHLSEPALSQFLGLRKAYENRFLQILETGKDNNEFTVADSKLTLLMLLSSLNWLHSWYKPDGMLTPEEIGEKLADVLLEGIKKRDVVLPVT